jgi:hypothetical protein
VIKYIIYTNVNISTIAAKQVSEKVAKLDIAIFIARFPVLSQSEKIIF